MIIGIDGNEANQKIRVGSGVYAFELLKQFKKVSAKGRSSSGRKFQIYLKDYPLEDMPKELENWRYKIVRPKKYWTQLGLPLKLWQEKTISKAPDVFFTPTHYAPRFCPVPSVITIFDLAFIRFPEMFLKKDLYQLKNWTEYSVRQAKKIITISEFSKKEIVDYYQIEADRVIVAYPGFDTERFNIGIKNSRLSGIHDAVITQISQTASGQELRIKNIKEKYKIDSSYIIYVGTVQPRKNLTRLIKAFKLLNNSNLKLVIAGMINEGRGGWMSDEILHQTQNDIIITGFINDEDLSFLMAGARTLVLPSLYEGFGIPIVEAMASGIPVVVSNTSSLPEVAGDGGILVDPYDVNSITNGIKEACYNEVKRKSMIEKGLVQVKKFSWTESAKIVLNTLMNL